MYLIRNNNNEIRRHGMRKETVQKQKSISRKILSILDLPGVSGFRSTTESPPVMVGHGAMPA